MFLNLLAIHETPPKLPEFSGHVLLDIVIPRVSEGKGDIASNSDFTVISTMPSSSTPQHLSLHSFP